MQLWIAFWTGKDFRYIPIHEISSALCPQLAKWLLFFHAFTGCDVTSDITNRGKESAWKPGLHDQRSHTVLSPSHSVPYIVNIPEDIIMRRERFVVFMYCRASDDMHVNTERMTLFSTMTRNIENIPSTHAALDQHVKRSSYQSGHQKYDMNLHNVTDRGWETS